MAFGINKFKSNLVGGGARPSLFEVSLTFPTFFGTDASSDAADFETEYQNAAFGTSDSVKVQSEFLIKGASIPASTVGTYDVFFHGKAIKVAGDRTFEAWTTTIFNDTDFAIRNAMERWMNEINSLSDNSGLTNPSDYQVDAFVDQLDRAGQVIKSYTFRGLFPLTIGNIDLAYDTNDAVEEFEATYRYQFFETNTTT